MQKDGEQQCHVSTGGFFLSGYSKLSDIPPNLKCFDFLPAYTQKGLAVGGRCESQYPQGDKVWCIPEQNHPGEKEGRLIHSSINTDLTFRNVTSSYLHKVK